MLTLTNVRKTFNRGTINEKVALQGVDLHLDRGDFVTVIGGNGAGKSTMLNMIAGVYPLDSGTITLDGHDISQLSEHARAAYLGRVFQDPMRGTAADMQIDENLALAARRGKSRTLRWGITKSERESYVEELRKLGLGLESRLSDKVGLLSGGQRQALTLLMATLQRPVLELTEQIVAEEGLTTLMVTHNMHDAIRLGNRLIMMADGKIIYDVRGEEKASLHRADLMRKFEEAAGEELANDRMLLG